VVDLRMKGELGKGVLEYDRIAKAYDELYRKEQEIKYLAVLRRVGRRFHLVLDLGCGTGLLSKYVECELMVGLDPSFIMLKEAKKRGVYVVQGVGEMLPFRPLVFDAVFLFTVIHENLLMIREALFASKYLVIVTLLKKLKSLKANIKEILLSCNRVSNIEIITGNNSLKDIIFIIWLKSPD